MDHAWLEKAHLNFFWMEGGGGGGGVGGGAGVDWDLGIRVLIYFQRYQEWHRDNYTRIYRTISAYDALLGSFFYGDTEKIKKKQ